jgi:hypothetical protein
VHVTDVLSDLERFFVRSADGGPVSVVVREAPGRPERLRSSERPCPRRRDRQELRDPRPPFSDVAPHLPEPPEESRQPQPRLGLSAVDRPLEGGADVVVLLLEPVEPGRVLLKEVRLRRLGHADELLRVSAPDLVFFAAFA